jgi:hypothetical protein
MDEVERVTGTVFVETDALLSTTSDDDDARETFINERGLTKTRAETVVMDSKRHDVGHGITYVFSVDAA